MTTRHQTKPTRTAVDENAWIVIPLYNEAGVIGNVIQELIGKFKNVICVDDGSTDDSGAIAAKAGARVLKHPINLGQGAALQTGISYARSQDKCDFIVTFDADGQHRVEDALSMLNLARMTGLGIVFGSRFLDNRTKPGYLKKVVLKTAVIITNMTTGVKLTDAHNGLRVIRKDAACGLELQQDRMAHATEIVGQLGSMGLPWAEFPVEVIYSDYSRSKGQSVLNSVNILVDLFVK